jgi:pimeloyl-[acyl-carrier protein] methyl ester esterase
VKGFLTLGDGRRLSWREAGSGPPLVLIHGWSLSSTVFTEALGSFAGRRRVLAVDLRGHGASDPGPGYALGDFAADLTAWFEALDLRRAAVLGWSLGGQVLLELYPILADRIERLILQSSTPRFAGGGDWGHGLPAVQVRAMARDLTRDYRRTMGDFFALQFAGEELPRERYLAVVDFAVRKGNLPEPAVALAALETLRLADQRPDLSAVDAPALVIHGEIDRIVPVAAGEALAAALPRGEFALVPGAGHAPFLSRPEETFALWRDFLS